LKQQLKLPQVGIALISFTLLWLSFFSFPSPKMINLDTSWQQLLAYTFQHHWQAGVDYIFTYGPLGYFSLKNPSYQADVFYPTIAWWLVTSSLLSLIFLAVGSKLHHWLERFIYLFLLIFIISEVSRFSDTFYFLAMMGATRLLIHPPHFLASPKRYVAALGIALCTFALLSLTKFIFFIFAIICVLGILIIIGQRYSLLTALTIPLTFMLMLMGSWLLCQQSLGNLPTFIANSLHLTSYYSEAMSYPVDLKIVWLGIYATGLITFMVILNGLNSPRQLDQWVSSGILLLGLFLNWKASFVRYETLIHGVMFFGFAMIAPFLLERAPRLKGVRPLFFSSLLFTNVLVTTFGTFYIVEPQGYTVNNFIEIWSKKIVNNTTTLWSLTNKKHDYDTVTAKLRQRHELPNIQKQVGYATVDMFPPQQGILLLNALNYHPRPLFQGYSAYTESLLEMNGNFYANPQQAPEFVLFGIDPLDKRFPTLEDSQVLNIILRDYRPLFMEKGFLLLKRHPRHADTIARAKLPVLTKEVTIGELIALQPLSENNLFLSLDIQKTLLGQLTTLFFQLPALFLEVETTDQMHFTYRLIPSMSQTDFLLNPLLLDQTDWLNWYLGRPLKRVATMRLIAESDWLWHLLKPTITVKLTDHEEVSPYPIDELTKHTLQNDLFSLALDSLPNFVSVPNMIRLNEEKKDNPEEEDKEAIWIVPSPGEMRFNIAPGNYKLTGQFGILSTDLPPEKASPVAGVQFSAIFVDAENQESAIFQKLLQPWQVAADKNTIKFNFTFNLTAAGTLVLHTQSIPFNNPLGKWAFWSGIKILPN
jgi:hypothetical protein